MSRKSRKSRRKRKLKRKLNAFFVLLSHYRAKNKGNTNLAVTDFAKNTKKFYDQAKSKLGSNASPEEVIKLGKSLIDKS